MPHDIKPMVCRLVKEPFEELWPKIRVLHFVEKLQREANFPHRLHFQLPPSEALKVISGGEPIVTNHPTENPLQWLHRFVTPDSTVGMMTELVKTWKRPQKKPLFQQTGSHRRGSQGAGWFFVYANLQTGQS